MKLFEAGKIGTMEVKNRIVMAPMNVGRMAEPDGTWGERVREYYSARARGGVGLITTGVVFISRKLEPFTRSFLNVHSDKHLESLHKVVEDVHRHGAKISIQLSPGFGRVLFMYWQDPSVTPISASAGPCYFNPERIARALTIEEAEELIQYFGKAAKRCQMAGVDAIELNGHSGYLLDQFMSGLWNRRTDKYGGSREKRLTFVKEAIAAIRKGVGEEFPLIYRFGVDHYLKGGRTSKESAWIAGQLEAMGFNALHVDAGCYETMWWTYPPTYQSPGCMVDMATIIKPVVKIPVITVGKLHYPDLAERILREGKADFIAIGRGLLADPDWANKVRAGNIQDIRPCIGDHEGCMGELSERGTSCTVNPICSHEKEWALSPISHKKSVLVVGGGPGGMEAARVAVQRGFSVTLWEKTDKLGGNLWPASVPEFKKDLRCFLDYQVSQLKKLPVMIELNTEASPTDILRFGADYTVLATGAVPVIPSIPGVTSQNILTARDLLLNNLKIGQTIVIIGGGLVGCETAVHLAQKGHQVTVIEILPNVLIGVMDHNRLMLTEMMANNKVKILSKTQIVKVTTEGVLVKNNGQDEVLPADNLVLAAGMSPLNDLQQSLTGKIAGLYTVGDCVAPRHILHAIWEAFNTMRTLVI